MSDPGTANPLQNPEDTAVPTDVVLHMSKLGVPQEVQSHGGRLNRGGTPGNRGAIIRRRKQHVAWLALQRLMERLKDRDKAEFIKDTDLIAAAKLDGDRIEVETGRSSQDTDSGEAAMQRVMAMVGRAVLAAPTDQRIAILAQLEAVYPPEAP